MINKVPDIKSGREKRTRLGLMKSRERRFSGKGTEQNLNKVRSKPWTILLGVY